MRIVAGRSEESIEEAVAALRDGRLVVVPTDTVYGLAADVRQDRAVEGIYELKGKATRDPLQLLFGEDAGMVKAYADLTPMARRFIDTLGPGGWTVIVLAQPGWSSPALAGGSTVGVRMPASDLVSAVVRGLGAPLAASSANRHGEPSPGTAAEAVEALGESEAVALVLDDGPAAAGIDSTVLDLSGPDPVIIREGAIDRGTVARILGLEAIPVLRSVRI